MQIFILIIFVLITAGLLTQVFVLTPLELLRHLSLPNWLVLGSLDIEYDDIMKFILNIVQVLMYTF